MCFKALSGLGLISALRSGGAIRRLLGTDGHLIRTDLEAERLAEITLAGVPVENG